MSGRRGNNEGSIYQVGDHWEASVTMRRGKRKRLRRATYAEAVRARDELIAERNALVDLDRRLTVERLLDEWLEDIKVSGVRPRTWQVYESAARVHIKPALGSVRAALLTPSEYRAFQTSLLRGDKRAGRLPLAPATVAQVRTVLNSAYRWAMVEERLPRSPVAVIRPPKRAPFEPQPFTLEQAVRVLEAIREHRYGPFWAFLLATGARFGEAAGLRWGDVDLEGAAVWLGHAKAPVPKSHRDPGDRTWEIAEMKTRHSQRPAPLTGFAVKALTQQAETVDRLRRAAGEKWQEHGLVFTTRVGTPLRDDHVGEAWHEVLRALKLEKDGELVYRLHDLRHTLGTLHRRSGTDLKVIQEMLGHASIRMTGDIYLTTAIPEALREAVRRFELMLEPRPPEPPREATG